MYEKFYWVWSQKGESTLGYVCAYAYVLAKKSKIKKLIAHKVLSEVNFHANYFRTNLHVDDKNNKICKYCDDIVH